MAYVLAAVGAAMAAAGLYTVGYSVLNTRFDEYWTALGAGATLTAGGTITIALGFTFRSLSQLRATLERRALATPVVEDVVQPPAALPSPDQVLAEPDGAPRQDATEAAYAGLPPVQIQNEEGPPAQPAPPLVPTSAPAIELKPAEHSEPARFEPPADEPYPSPVTRHQEAEATPPDAERDIMAPARPADDYKLETPSTSEHDLPAFETPRPYVAPSPPPEMPDDWLDRAFAELDEEMPVKRPAPHDVVYPVPTTPTATPMRPPTPDLQPAVAEPDRREAEPAAVATEPTPRADVSAKQSPSVIGRYEADGTSYVMYADGSIEAQSSSGVYRFASMAELKSFIEN